MSNSLRKLLVFSLVGFGVFCFLKGLPSSVTHRAADGLMSDAVASVHSELSAPPPPSSVRTQAIETIKVGQRVLAKNPEVSSFERHTRGPEPNFASWLHLTLEMPKPDGSNLTINMLRSEEWLRNQIGYVVGEKSTPSGERLGVSKNPPSATESASVDLWNFGIGHSPHVPLSPLRPIFTEILLTSLAVEEEGAELVGMTVQMDLPELGLTGEAILTDIRSAPAIEPPVDHLDTRQVVTATFHHSSGDVIDLVLADSRSFLSGLSGRTFAAGEPQCRAVVPTAQPRNQGVNDWDNRSTEVAASREVLSGREDQQEAASDSPLSAFGSPLSPACEVGASNHEPAESEETIGTTSNHPFWSVDRQEFVQAGSLEIGERLRTLSGDVKVVHQKLPRPAPLPVFNLEVHNEHVYFVGEDGVLVHNAHKKYSEFSNDDEVLDWIADGNTVEVGPHTVGNYSSVQGHHVHQQAAYATGPGVQADIYDDMITVQQKPATFRHSGSGQSFVSSKQNRLNSRLVSAMEKKAIENKPELVFSPKVEDAVQNAALRAGGFTTSERDILIRLSRRQLERLGKPGPLRVPGKKP